MQQTVRLLDDLGKRYGSEHVYFNLRSPAEAIKLLCINHPALQKELTEAHQHGVGYTLVQAGTFLGYEDLQLPLGKNDLVLAPVIAGSGSSAGQILAGVGLIGLSLAFPGGGLFGGTVFGFLGGPTASAAFLTTVGTGISAVGASLVLGGVSQMLSPQPTIGSLQNRTAPGQNTNASGPQGVSRALSGQQSYAFTGPANTVGVGATVPLVYGKLLIGSHLLSSRVDVTSESDPTGEFFSIPGENSVTINAEKLGYKFRSLNGLRTRRWQAHHVKPGNDTSGPGAKRTSPNTVIRFDQTNNFRVADVTSLDAEGSTRRKNLQIIFELQGGLFNVIGGQMVPAFATYEMKIVKAGSPGVDETAAIVRGTIQGLLKETDSYRFAHAITYATIGDEDGDTTARLNIRIIDTDAEGDGRLIVRRYGYNLFEDDTENNTEDLTEV